MFNYSWLQFSTLHHDDYPPLFKLALCMNTEIYLSQLEKKTATNHFRDIIWSKMAARSDAAAAPGPKNGVLMSVSLVSSSSKPEEKQQKHQETTVLHVYDRQRLLEIGRACNYHPSPVTTEKLRGLCLLRKSDPETVDSPTAATRTRRCRKQCERGCKRGKRGGIRARLKANPTRPAPPTILLSNVRSLENKLDLFRLGRTTQRETRECCVFVFTETWLNNNIPDSAIQLHGLTCYRADRDTALSGKTRGGGLCVYINKEWCNNAVLVKNTARRWWSL